VKLDRDEDGVEKDEDDDEPVEHLRLDDVPHFEPDEITHTRTHACTHARTHTLNSTRKNAEALQTLYKRYNNKKTMETTPRINKHLVWF